MDRFVDKSTVLILSVLASVVGLAVSGTITGSDAVVLISAVSGYVLRETTGAARQQHEQKMAETAAKGNGHAVPPGDAA